MGVTRLGWVDDPGAVCADDVLVLIPSLGTTSRLFDGLVADLRRRSPELGIVRVDLPGHGTGPHAENVALEELAEEVVDIVARVAARRVRVAGVSMGGAIALEAARRAPAVVGGFAMINSGVRFGTDKSWQRLIDGVERQGIDSLRPGSAAGWFSDDFAGSGTAAAILADIPAVDPRTYVACCRALAAYRGSSGIDEIEPPAVLIGTSDDLATPAAGLRALARILPSADYFELPNGRHLSLVEHIVAVSTILAHWLAKEQ